MKIVQAVGWYFPDSVGGTEVYVEALAGLLQQAGHDVAIAVPSPGAPASSLQEWRGATVFRYPIPRHPTRDEAQGRVAVRGAGLFHEWLAVTAPDIVHLHTFVTGLGLHEIAAARRAGARVVVTTHSSSLGFLCQRGTLMLRGETLCDGIVEPARCAACELEHRGASRTTATTLAAVPAAAARLIGAIPGPAGTALGMQALIEHNLARQQAMFALVHRFVVLTDRAADIVCANGGPRERIAVNRLGVSHGPFDGPRPDPTPWLRVGYVGRFDPIKGVFDLADALGRLPIELPLRCELRGPANTPADREARARLEGLFAGDPRVEIADAVQPAGIPALMRRFDLLCCPSRCLEGGPTSGLEAIAAGTPVMAANAGGLAEVVVDGVSGRLVPPGDVTALAAALDEVARCRSLVDGWREKLPPVRTMREVAADYLALYEAA